jgi:hypothetical protein
VSADARDLLGDRYTRKQLAELPTVGPLIEGVLSKPGVVTLVGPYGGGKTCLSLAWASCVATGTPWLGRPVDTCPVLYLVGEGAYGLHARLHAWEQQTGADLVGDELAFLVRPDSLAKDEVWDAIETEAETEGRGLVVLDTFSSLAPDADETRDAARIMRRCADLASNIEGTVLLVHHPGWSDAGRARGGYQLEANADEVLILAGEQDSPQINVTRKKVKDGPDGDVLWLARKPAHGSVVIEAARLDEIDAPLKTRIRVALQMTGAPGLTAAQLRDFLGKETKLPSIYRVLRQLDNAGLAAEFKDRGLTRYRLPAFDLEKEG